jgi:FAD/FMN-containing dehydrogenase
MKDIYGQLGDVIKGEVQSDDETLKKYSTDASLFKIKPRVVVFPRDAEDVKALVKFVAEHKKNDPKLSLTVRSGGTDMTGGPLTESIVVDVNRHMTGFKGVREDPSDAGTGYATAMPGMYYRNFEKETLKKGFMMPSYPASREICTVGGMAANNSGGEKTLTYGKTEDYLKEIKMVLRDGNEYSFSPITKRELDKKVKLSTVEGEIYRELFNLLDKNYDAIKKAKPNVSKNSAGYFLWNVWDREKGVFDIPKLIAGSQGTLGIITEITFRLIKPKRHSTLLIIFLKDFEELGNVVERVLKHNPESFESYDDNTVKIALRFLPDMIKLIGAKSLVSLGFQFLPELRMAVTGGMPKLFLEAEFTGDSEDEIYKKAYAAQADLEKFGFKMRVAKSDQEEKKYWTVRRESFNLLRNHVQGKRTAPFIDDIVVRPERLPEFLPRLNNVMEEYDLVYTIAGHVGNGNFHIIPLMNMKDPRSKKIIPELSGKVYDLVIEFEGSITAEHNDGLIRSPFLKQMYGSSIYGFFEDTKRIFDPDNLFNPGKKVNSDFSYALEHLALES